MTPGNRDSKRMDYTDTDHLLTIIRALPPPPMPSREELLGDDFTLEPEPIWLSRLTSGRHPVPIALGSCALVLVSVLGIEMDWSIPLPQKMTLAQEHIYETRPGGRREIILRDQSVVTLAGSTKLTVLFSEHRRRVTLTQGEALFKVEHNARMPFEVYTGNGSIRDLGTTFDIRRYTDQVDVTVTEGTVVVTPGSDLASSGLHTKVEAGEALSYDNKGEIGHAHSVDAGMTTAWLSGHRVYRGKPLRKVIDDLQLYSIRRIELDPALDTVPFTGYIDQGQAEQWVLGLPTIYPVEVEMPDPHRLLIRCRSPGCTNLPP